MLGQYNRVSPRIRLHRNPSMIPTTGLSEYRSRHFCGTTELLKPTGDIYMPNWTINGTTYRKSLYFTLSAHSQTPTPIAKAIARARNIGNNTTCHVGA